MATDNASLTQAELEAARDFLRQAETLVSAVRGMLLGGGHTTGARRLNDVQRRLADQIKELEDLISKRDQ